MFLLIRAHFIFFFIECENCMKLYDDAEVFISEMYEFCGTFFFLGLDVLKETFQNYNMKKKKN